MGQRWFKGAFDLHGNVKNNKINTYATHSQNNMHTHKHTLNVCSYNVVN